MSSSKGWPAMKAEQDVKSAVLLPLLQALVTAVLVALLAGVAAHYLKAEQPFLLALAVFGGVALLSWLFYRAEWRARLEAVLGVGVATEQPVTSVNELRVSIISEDGRAGDFLNLPGVDREQLASLARGIVAGRGLAVHEWTGIKRPFTRSQFEELRGQLIERGFIRWRGNSPNQGIEPTKKGEALFRALASDNLLPTRAPGAQIKPNSR